MTRYRNFKLLHLCAIALLGATAAKAAPNITSMSVRGLQIGATTRVVFSGSDLIPAPRIVTSIAITKQTVIKTPLVNRVEMDITLDDDVIPGVYNLRLASGAGISPGVVVSVDRLPQIPFAPKIESLPVAMHGTLSGSNIAKTSFSGSKGQQVIIDVEASRIAGKLRPVIHLYDAARRQIGLSLPDPSLSGDARLTTSLPDDGDYTIELHDLEYAAPAPNHYRIKVGMFHYADMVYPPAVQVGKNIQLTLVGNVPEDQRIEINANSLIGYGNVAPVHWSKLKTATGAPPRIEISSFPEFVESLPTADLQKLSKPPVAVSGRLNAREQADRYTLPVTEGAKLRFEVFADRLGSPIDVNLEIKNDKGARLAFNDDIAGTTDSRVDYTVAKGVTSVEVVVKDEVGRAGDRSIYRLVATQLDDETKNPSFTLNVNSDTYNVPEGATRVLHVTAERENYDGPIKILVDGLPPGISIDAPDIPTGSNATLVTIRGAGKAANAIARIRGTSVGLKPEVTTTAKFGAHPLSKTMPWMMNDIALAIAPPTKEPFRLEWSKPVGDTPLVLGTTFKAPLKLVRPSAAIGPIRLSVVVGEPVPVVNNRPDANRAVRAERATLDIAIDAKAKAAFDALAAADKAVVAAKAKAKVMSDAQAKLVVTAVAEMKQANAKNVTAKAGVDLLQVQTKTAEQTRANASQAVEQAKATLAAAKDEVAKATANATLLEASKQLALTEKAVADVKSKLALAQTAADVAAKALATVSAKLDAVQKAANQANINETNAVKAAEMKRTLAAKAFKAAEANIKKDAEFNVIVPPNFTATSCDLVVKAELRSLDNRTLLAEVYSPVRRFVPLHPLGLKLSDQPIFETHLDAKTGATIKLTGTIERKAGFNGDVTVSIVGQPGGVAVPKVVVKADKQDFAMDLKFPANFKPGKVESIKLFATGPPDKTKANIIVRIEIPITVNLLEKKAEPKKK